MKKFVCSHPWTHFEINNPNGDVTMCCDNNTVLGTVADGTSVRDVWNGEGFQNIRKRMRDEGAHAICPHTCPVLNGGKSHQEMNWHGDMAEESLARQNAELNEVELADGKLALESLPRWMRFTYSYLCNLDCYHCYQREDAVSKVKLPQSFMDEIKEMAPYFQVVFPFGGEPFLFKPVLEFIDDAQVDAGCRYFFVTNATLLNDRIFKTLREREIGMMAVSLDAADAETFDELRVRGRTGSWDDVITNLEKLKEFKKEKNFYFPISMTLNTRNFDQVETFVDLCLKYDGEPQVILVTNPYQKTSFQKEFLNFSDKQFDEINQQIERSIKKVEVRGFKNSIASLTLLRGHLAQHRQFDNNPNLYASKTFARKVFNVLPESLKRPIKSFVQGRRASELEMFSKAADGD
jgi:sulfatase maturation enzyme AslB (radical SAM superfamily)